MGVAHDSEHSPRVLGNISNAMRFVEDDKSRGEAEETDGPLLAEDPRV